MAGVSLAIATPARADPRSDAERLFQEGRAAFEAKDYPTACAKLADSQRLDPNPSTLFNLAYCEEKRGQLVSAWHHYREGYLQLSPKDNRLPIAKQWLATLETRLPRLTLRLAARAPADTSVHIGGAEIPASALGTPQPVDPGEHVIVVTASGRAERRFDLEVAERQQLELTVDVGAVAAPTATPSPAPSQREGDRAPAAGRTAGFVIIGVGAAAVALGAVAGGLALAKKGTMREHCDADLACDQIGYDAAQAGSTWSTLSTVAFAAGGASLAVGIAVVLLRGKRSHRAATATIGPRGVALGARF